jgi:hypothetical protein
LENQEKYKFREKISFDAMFVAAVNRKSAFQDAVPNLHFQGGWTWAPKLGTRLLEFLNVGMVLLEISMGAQVRYETL